MLSPFLPCLAFPYPVGGTEGMLDIVLLLLAPFAFSLLFWAFDPIIGYFDGSKLNLDDSSNWRTIDRFVPLPLFSCSPPCCCGSCLIFSLRVAQVFGGKDHSDAQIC